MLCILDGLTTYGMIYLVTDINIFASHISDLPVSFLFLWANFKASVVIPEEYACMNKEIIPYVS